MDTLSPVELTGLMCARICHDFSNRLLPLGASIDVLTDDQVDPEMQRDMIQLLEEAGALAHARLSLLRLAFGACDARAQLEVDHLADVCRRSYLDPQIEITWRAAGPTWPARVGRILANLIVLTAEALPRGGNIVVETSVSNDRLRVAGEGRRVRIEQHIAAALDGQAPEGGFEPHNAQPYLTGAFVRHEGGRVSLHAEEGRIEFAALIPSSGSSTSES